MSILEIYKENLHDLIDPNVPYTDLKIKEHPKKGIYVQNLTSEYISSPEEMFLLIENAEAYRVVSETGLNNKSSRSHMLLIIEIHQQFPDETEKSGTLYLVDLAGSEKISKTKAQGETLEEAKKINLSLSTIGNLISSLTSDSKSDFIPYRESKLTRILQDSLGGNNKTTLIVTCSPHIYNIEETVSTLKFASRAKKIKNKVKMNIKLSTEQLEALVEKLKADLATANNKIKKLRMLLDQNGVSCEDVVDFVDDKQEYILPEEQVSGIAHASSGELDKLRLENENLKSEIESLKSKVELEQAKISGIEGLSNLENSIVKVKQNFLEMRQKFNINLNEHLLKENEHLKKGLSRLEESLVESKKQVKVVERVLTDISFDSYNFDDKEIEVNLEHFEEFSALLLGRLDDEELYNSYEFLIKNSRNVLI